MIKFGIRVAEVHSWYKHLPGFPGKQLFVSQCTVTRAEKEKKLEWIHYETRIKTAKYKKSDQHVFYNV